MIKNIIFDWSGTLSDDLAPVYKAAMNVFKKIGIRNLSLEEYKREFVLPYMDFYAKFKENVDKEEVDRLFLKEIQSVGEPKPFPDAKNLLKWLNKRKINMALLSSHPKKKIDKEIIDYDFGQYFLDIEGSVHDKTIIIEKIMKKNKFNNKETAYVGDMTHDVDAGRKAKIKTVAVLWGYQTKEQLSKSKPDYIAENFKRLKEIIENLK